MTDLVAHEVDEPQELKADRKAPQRRCIVCRESCGKEELIRFVIGPKRQLTPDLANKLPGRGLWVHGRRGALEKACSRKLFHKVARGPVELPPALPEQVQHLLGERALQALALANKAAALLAGFDAIAAHKGGVLALIHAEDAAEDGVRKLARQDCPVWRCFSREQLGARLGRDNIVHLAILPSQAGAAALKEIRRFTGFLE